MSISVDSNKEYGFNISGVPFSTLYAKEFDLLVKMGTVELAKLATEAFHNGNRDLTFLVAGMLLTRAADATAPEGIGWRQPSPFNEVSTSLGALDRVALVVNNQDIEG